MGADDTDSGEKAQDQPMSCCQTGSRGATHAPEVSGAKLRERVERSRSALRPWPSSRAPGAPVEAVRVADSLDLPVDLLARRERICVVSAQSRSDSRPGRTDLLMLLVVTVIRVDRRPDLLLDAPARSSAVGVRKGLESTQDM
jgi:hypothetical protein